MHSKLAATSEKGPTLSDSDGYVARSGAHLQIDTAHLQYDTQHLQMQYDLQLQLARSHVSSVSDHHYRCSIVGARVGCHM